MKMDKSSASHQQHEEILDDIDTDLNVRVKERDATTTSLTSSSAAAAVASGGARLGALFRGVESNAASTLKDTITRPLTGLFRRPGSRSTKRADANASGGDANGRLIIDDRELEQLQSTVVDIPSVTTGLAITPEIPQLEDSIAIDGVAHAPSIVVNRVATYHQLDSTLMKHAAFSTLEDIDLSLLTRYLCSEAESMDEAVAWTWDYLYASVCSEMREEWSIDDVDDDDQQQSTNISNQDKRSTIQPT